MSIKREDLDAGRVDLSEVTTGRRLPLKQRGYYREYTVTTPGSKDRGARRIVAGAQPPAGFYYTEDHYRSFSRIQRQD